MKRLLLFTAILVVALLMWFVASTNTTIDPQAHGNEQRCENRKTERTPSSTGTGFFIIDSFSGIL
ncbi:MAG: hypothetical protein ACK4E8_04245 [Lacibacter sp.]